MRVMSKLAAATAALACIAAPAAFAQGPWSGAYVGGQVQLNKSSGTQLSSENGLGLGIYGGYQYQFHRHFVFGGGLFYDYNQKKDHSIYNPNGTLAGTQKFGTKVYGLDLLAGFPVGTMGKWMPYVKLGYGWSKIHASGVDVSGTESDMRYGVGVAWMIQRHLSLNAQFMYFKVSDHGAHFKNQDLSVGATWHFPTH